MIAQGIISAVSEVKTQLPVVVRLEGNNAELAAQILEKSGLNVIAADSFEDGAKRIVAAVGDE
jgi:succinyl-CoA synthetase beta subunit